MRVRWPLCVLLVGCARPESGEADSAEVRQEGWQGWLAPGEASAPSVPPRVYVCPDGSGDTANLQAALETLAEGTQVRLCGQVFVGPVEVRGRAVTIVGEPGAELDGAGTGTTVTVRDGGSLALTGVRVTGGEADVGGGVRCEDAEVRLDGVEVQGNRARRGAGLGAERCDVEVVDSAFVDNAAEQDGGGVLLDGSRGTIVGTRASGNDAHRGGGFAVLGGGVSIERSALEQNRVTQEGGGAYLQGDVSFAGNLVRGNSAVWSGGGVFQDGGAGQLVENVFEANTTGEDGAGLVTWSSAASVAGNTFAGNVAQDDAGGLRVLEGHARVERNTFTRNEATGGDGGAAKVSHGSNVVSDNVFEDNRAGGSGGGLELDDDSSHLVRNVFRRNVAARAGGGLHVWIANFDVRVEDGLFEANDGGRCGGGVAAQQDAFPLYLTRVRVIGNSASRGGGVCLERSSGVLTAAILEDNEAREGGAVMAADGSVRLENVVVRRNQAEDGAALSVDGALAGAQLRNAIVLGNTGASWLSAPEGVARAVWSIFWANDAGDAPWVGQDGNVEVDPLVGPDARLLAGSPAIDAGDPEMRDVDGTRVDVGAFGGESGGW